MGGNNSKVTSQDKAILDMKNQRDKLHQYQRRITILTDKETDIAKQMLAKGDKPKALLALRRKKYQETLLAKTDAQLEQLEQLTSSVEFAQIQKDVVFGLQQGTKVLQDIHKEMGGLEHVEKLMGESADEIAYQKEVSEMLGGRITNHEEEEVEDELEALEAQIRDSKQGDKVALPSAPEDPLPKVEVGAQPAVQAREQRQAMLAE
ncbi:Vacuolar protein sorting-associated protein 20 [Lecanicillium sp. MT-2017a]|nr:Vacuolar protein sorting-associated protein 20 [Lecanicillium sp. MT-2017a]